MKVTLSWLNEYVKVDDLSVEFIADKLLNIGLEVESVRQLGENIKKVYTAQILDIKQHENADKLVVCTVDMGKIVTAVTGAKNFKVGDKVCMADIGASLPPDIIIKAVDLKGIVSQGMLCSGKELGLTNDIIDRAEDKGLLILPDDAPIGVDVVEYLCLDDYVFDISITANRGDCQSVYGIARELAAALGRELKPLNLSYKTYEKQINNNFSVKISDKDCSRYLGAIIEDIEVSPSPLWLRRRLYACGMSSKNNIVDITNYVLLETGQPLHAFDKSIIDGGIIIRKANKNEEITALNGSSYKLSQDMLVIADHRKALAIAGVMGGQESAINQRTKSVFLESARFARGSIRQTSRKLGLRSDSSNRFERGVDYHSVDIGRERALTLFDSLKVGKIISCDIKDELPPPTLKTIQMKHSQIKKILGIEIPKDFVKDIFTKLEFLVKECNGEYTITAPQFREDIDNFTDIIEEIIRFYGYDNLLATQHLSSSLSYGKISKRLEIIEKIQQLCCGIGAYEIKNYSFIGQKHFDKLILQSEDKLRKAIKILNPLSEDYSLMRTQLVSSMLETIHRNQVRQNKDFILFEIDNVFLSDKLPLTKLPNEELSLCMGFCLDNQDFYLVKSFVKSLLDYFGMEYSFERSKVSYLHPGISADILIDGKVKGYIGKLHPLAAKNFETTQDVFLVELNLESILNKAKPIPKFMPLPKFPYVERDLAVIVSSDTLAGKVIEIILNSDKLVKEVQVFDVYSGSQIPKNHKSLALNIILQSKDKTLTEEEINSCMAKILKNLSSIGATLRQ